MKMIPFPEKVGALVFITSSCNANDFKPAVIEERNGEIEFRVCNNDNTRESLIILTGLKNIFQKQVSFLELDQYFFSSRDIT